LNEDTPIENAQAEPCKQLTQEQIAWVIASHRRTMQYRKTFRIISKLIRWIIAVFKYFGDSLKWAGPLFLSGLAAYQSGALKNISGLIDILKEFYG